MITEKQEAKLWRSLMLVAVGTCLFMLASIGIGGFFAPWLFAFGFMLAIVGMCEFGFALGMREAVLKFIKNKRALGWQLVVFGAAVIAFSIAWFAATWPADMIYEAIIGIYTFTGATADAITFARGLMGLLVGVGLFLTIIWLWVNVHRRDAVYG